MNERRRVIRIIRVMATVALGVAIAGCKPSTNLVRPCCYGGDAALVHLVDTRLVLEGGDTVAFGDVFPGLEADPDSFGRIFPFDRADIGLATPASLRDLLRRHDADGNGILEEPELTVLYVEEAARGFGYPVARIEPGGGAIATSRADVSALVRFVERHRHEMTQPQQKVFRDLYRLGREVNTIPHFFEYME